VLGRHLLESPHHLGARRADRVLRPHRGTDFV
jgi:hypothetical protein